MNDLRPTIIPKSDQLNADDLIGGPLTVTVTKVLLTGSGDQPVAVHFEGDNGKPYKPCKSMRRLMVALWGPDGNDYIGRSMTLYRDNAVTFGNAPVGGIRISHMSHLAQPVTIPLTEKRAQRKPYTVHPLIKKPSAGDIVARAEAIAARGSEAMRNFWKSLSAADRDALKPSLPKLQAIAKQADEAPADPFGLPDGEQISTPDAPPDSDFPGDRP